MIMLGAVAAVTGIVSEKALAEAVETVLEGKKQSLIDVNQKALVKGLWLRVFLQIKLYTCAIAVHALARGHSGGFG